MKKIIGLVISLTVISGVCAAVLAYVDSITKGPIAEMKVKQEQAAVKAVLPDGVEKVESEKDFYVGRTSGNAVGYAAKGTDAGGYGGDVTLMVGFKADKKTVVCYKVLAAAETPGLGMKLNTPEFVGQFHGQDATTLKLKKNGGAIEAITSATITSKAVIRAIADAQKKLK